MNEIFDYLLTHSPALIVAVPLLGAFLTPLFGMLHSKLRDVFVVFITLLTGFFGVILANDVLVNEKIRTYCFGASNPNVNPVVRIFFEVDGFSAFMALIAVILPIVAIIYSLKYMKGETGLDKYYSLMLLMTVGMLGMVLTGDLFNFFVFLEITSIASAALIAFWNHKKNSVQAAFKYIVISSIGALMVLFAVAIFYGQYNALNMAVIANNISLTFLDKIAFVLLISALFMKAAIAPLHMWLADAYSGAPSSATVVIVGTTLASLYAVFRVTFTIYGKELVSVVRTLGGFEFVPMYLIAGIIVIIAAITLLIGLYFALKSNNNFNKTMGNIAILEIFYIAFIGILYVLYGNQLFESTTLGTFDLTFSLLIGVFMIILAIITIFIGVFMALKSNNLKRMIAYAAVAEIGYMLIAVGTAISTFASQDGGATVGMTASGKWALTGGVFHIFNDALDIGLLFLVAGAVYYVTKETSIDKLGGLSRKMKYTTIFFLIGLFAASGLPPLNGFASKLIIYQSTYQINPILAIVAILASIMLLAVFVKVFYSVFMGPKLPNLGKVKEVPITMLVSMGILAALIIFIGLFPDFVINNLVDPAVNALTSPDSYINAIIGGA